MSSPLNYPLVFALATVLAVLALLPSALSADIKAIKNFKDLQRVTSRLESAEMQLGGRSPTLEKERYELLNLFAHENKAERCDHFYKNTDKTADEFKIKGYMYVDELKKGKKNFFGSLFNFGGPMGAMKNLAGADNILNKAVEKYENMSKEKKELTRDEVNCDVNMYLIRRLHWIAYILQTDVTYLVIEDPQVQNKAIFTWLKDRNFVSKGNFYGIQNPTPAQRKLLLQFLSERVDVETMSAGQALDRYYDPGEYILGRLLESCQSLIHYNDMLDEVHAAHDRCPSQYRDALFDAQYPKNKYDQVGKFCQNLLDAL